MRRPSRLAPLLLALAAPGAAAPLAPPSPTTPSFDCRRASVADERLLCAEPALGAQDRRLAHRYGWSLALARDPAARQRLAAEQVAWLASRRACAEGPGAPAGRASQVDCLAARGRARLEALERATGPVPEAALRTRAAKVAEKPGCLALDFAWPELDGALPGAAAFNAHFRRSPPAPCPAENPFAGDPDHAGRPLGEETLSFEIAWATPRYVTVILRTSGFRTGAAHPNHASSVETFDLERRRPVAPEQVFRADPAASAGLAAAVVRRLDPEALFEDGPAKVGKSILRPGLWRFDARGATAVFNPYEVAPYAAGEPEAAFAWEELRPWLREDSPLPPRGAPAGAEPAHR
jgi:uncharacterized protein